MFLSIFVGSVGSVLVDIELVVAVVRISGVVVTAAKRSK